MSNDMDSIIWLVAEEFHDNYIATQYNEEMHEETMQTAYEYAKFIIDRYEVIVELVLSIKEIDDEEE